MLIISHSQTDECLNKNQNVSKKGKEFYLEKQNNDEKINRNESKFTMESDGCYTFEKCRTRSEENLRMHHKNHVHKSRNYEKVINNILSISLPDSRKALMNSLNISKHTLEIPRLVSL